MTESCTDRWVMYRLRGFSKRKSTRMAKLRNPNAKAYELLAMANTLRIERRYQNQSGMDYQVFVDGYSKRIDDIGSKISELRKERSDLKMLVRANKLISEVTKNRRNNQATTPCDGKCVFDE